MYTFWLQVNARRPESFPDHAWYGWENVWLGFVDHELCLCIRLQYLREEVSSFVSRNITLKKKKIKNPVCVLSVTCPRNLITKTHSLCICTKEIYLFFHLLSYFCRCLIKLNQIFLDTVLKSMSYVVLKLIMSDKSIA